MALEETFDRIAMNIALLTGAVATLSESVNGKYAGKPIYADNVAKDPASATAPAATPKPRGRPARGETAASTASAASTAAVEADPFATLVTAPTATLDEVRAALTALKEARTQADALKVLKDSSGVDNLGELQKTPEKYGAVVAAAKAALPDIGAAAVADPFETATEASAEPAKSVTLEEVKAACVAAGKRTGQDKVQKIVMDHGGRGKNAATGVEGPSLNALSKDNYAAVIAAVSALPTTK